MDAQEEAMLAEEAHDEPLLMSHFTYHDLARLIRRFNFAPEGSSSSPMQLTPDLMRKVIGFIVIQSVDQQQVRVVGSSSSDDRHPLEACLDESESSWWISGPQSMPNGRGEEWVEFCLGPSRRRLSTVSLKIPPLPQGPLSVREFRIDHLLEDNLWVTAQDRPFHVANRSGWQTFALPALMDVHRVRIVCLTNQMSQFIDEPLASSAAHLLGGQFSCVGFYAVRFD